MTDHVTAQPSGHAFDVKADETILEAANRLYKAAQGKNAPVMFVIATQRGGYFEFEDQFPSNVVIVDAPALSIVDALAQIKDENLNKYNHSDD